MQANEAQQKAIEHDQGPMMVLAAPGSGKTRVITERACRLINEAGVDERRILVITFTRAAALEMKQRFLGISGLSSTRVMFGTFHSVFFRIIRDEYHYTVDSVIKEKDQKAIVSALLKRENLDLPNPAESVTAVLEEISRVKNDHMDLEHYYSTLLPEESFRRIYRGYDEELHDRKLIDFDDMQLICSDLLTSREDVRKRWQSRFRYILIDEFQDINTIQYEIIRILAAPENNLFIVGDDDQSIYHFRGARPEIMLGFPKDYPDLEQVTLNVNYRSSSQIIGRASNLISHNKNRYPKKVVSAMGEAEPVRVSKVTDLSDEMNCLIRDIDDSRKKGTPYSDMAVIYRTNQESRTVAAYLAKRNIPFKVRDSVYNIFNTWPARDILAYVGLATGNMDRRLFLQVMNRPLRYISRDALTSEKVNPDSLVEYYLDRNQKWMAERIEQLMGDLSFAATLKPYAAVNYIRHGIDYDGEFLKGYCSDNHIDFDEITEILDQVQESARNMDTFAQWSDFIRDYSEKLKESRKSDDRDAVVLTTMHQSKGLEFENVYILNACEDICPYKKAETDDAIAEERRMFYVAVTRARRHLRIFVPENIYNHRRTESRFIREMEEEE